MKYFGTLEYMKCRSYISYITLSNLFLCYLLEHLALCLLNEFFFSSKFHLRKNVIFIPWCGSRINNGLISHKFSPGYQHYDLMQKHDNFAIIVYSLGFRKYGLQCSQVIALLTDQ